MGTVKGRSDQAVQMCLGFYCTDYSLSIVCDGLYKRRGMREDERREESGRTVTKFDCEFSVQGVPR